MKKLLSLLVPFFMFISCNNSSNSGSTPTAIDSSTQHPNGITNGSVISTDTAAMSQDNTGNVHGGDSTNPK